MNELHRGHRRQLFQGYAEKVESAQKLDTVQMPEKRDLFTRIQYQFQDDDKAALDQIKAAARVVINETFNALLAAIDEFYLSFRKAKTNAYGVIELDKWNRVVFATDEQGRYIDDFTSMSGQDIEIALLRIYRDKIDANTKVKELFQEALFSKHIWDDAYQEHYERLIEGTINDRHARATRDTKQFKYHAYFTFYVFNLAEGILDEINNLARILEKIRQWGINDQYNHNASS